MTLEKSILSYMRNSKKEAFSTNELFQNCLNTHNNVIDLVVVLSIMTQSNEIKIVAETEEGNYYKLVKENV